MSNEELIEEIRNGHNVEQNKLQLYNQNRGFIYRVAIKYCDAGEDINDYLITGYCAIEACLKSYDSSKAKFTTLLVYQLHKDFIINQLNSKGIGTSARTYIYSYRKAIAKILIENREPTTETIAEKMGVDIKRVERLKANLNRAYNTMSLYQTMEDDETPLIDGIPDGKDIENDIVNTINTDEFFKAMQESLTRKEYTVIYGIYFQGKTAMQIATERGVSFQNISEQHKKAMKKLSKNEILQDLYKTYVL
jgi:RNA polymerase sigma factor (sigma-70 family)